MQNELKEKQHYRIYHFFMEQCGKYIKSEHVGILANE
jgi:hypothetical protein